MITKQYEFVFTMTLCVILLLCFSIAAQEENVATNSETYVVREHQSKCSRELTNILAKFKKNFLPFVKNNYGTVSEKKIFSDPLFNSGNTAEDYFVTTQHDNPINIEETNSATDNPVTASEISSLDIKENHTFPSVSEDDLNLTTNSHVLVSEENVLPVTKNYTFFLLQRNSSDNVDVNSHRADSAIFATNNSPFIPINRSPLRPPNNILFIPKSDHNAFLNSGSLSRPLYNPLFALETNASPLLLNTPLSPPQSDFSFSLHNQCQNNLCALLRQNFPSIPLNNIVRFSKMFISRFPKYNSPSNLIQFLSHDYVSPFSKIYHSLGNKSNQCQNNLCALLRQNFPSIPLNNIVRFSKMFISRFSKYNSPSNLTPFLSHDHISPFSKIYHILGNNSNFPSQNIALLYHQLPQNIRYLASPAHHRVHLPSSVNLQQQNLFLRFLLRNLYLRNGNHFQQRNHFSNYLASLPISLHNYLLLSTLGDVNNSTTASIIKSFLLSLNNHTSDNPLYIPSDIPTSPSSNNNDPPSSGNSLNNASGYDFLLSDIPLQLSLNQPLYPQSNDGRNHPINNQLSSTFANTPSFPSNNFPFSSSDKPSSKNDALSLPSDTAHFVSPYNSPSILANIPVPVSSESAGILVSDNAHLVRPDNIFSRPLNNPFPVPLDNAHSVSSNNFPSILSNIPVPVSSDSSDISHISDNPHLVRPDNIIPRPLHSLVPIPLDNAHSVSSNTFSSILSNIPVPVSSDSSDIPHISDNPHLVRPDNIIPRPLNNLFPIPLDNAHSVSSNNFSSILSNIPVPVSSDSSDILHISDNPHLVRPDNIFPRPLNNPFPIPLDNAHSVSSNNFPSILSNIPVPVSSDSSDIPHISNNPHLVRPDNIFHRPLNNPFPIPLDNAHSVSSNNFPSILSNIPVPVSSDTGDIFLSDNPHLVRPDNIFPRPLNNLFPIPLDNAHSVSSNNFSSILSNIPVPVSSDSSDILHISDNPHLVRPDNIFPRPLNNPFPIPLDNAHSVSSNNFPSILSKIPVPVSSDSSDIPHISDNPHLVRPDNIFHRPLNNLFPIPLDNAHSVSSNNFPSILSNIPVPVSSDSSDISHISDNFLLVRPDNVFPRPLNNPIFPKNKPNSLLREPTLHLTSDDSLPLPLKKPFSVLSDNPISVSRDRYPFISSDLPVSFQSDNNLFLPSNNYFPSSLNNSSSNIKDEDISTSNPFIKYLHEIFRKLLVLHRLYHNCKSLTVMPTTATTYEARYNLPVVKNIIEYIYSDADKYVPKAANRYNSKDRFGNEALYGRERGGFNDREIGDRIIGGRLVSPGEVPYQVALYKIEVFVCGSSLISQYYVLTAGHCLKGMRPEELWFRVGSHSLTEGGETYRVLGFVVHEKFANADYDIGLIKSETAVEFGPNVKPIRLPLVNDPHLLPYTPVEASGWGAIEADHGALPVYNLHKILLKIATAKRCRNRIMVSSRMITERQICTIGPASAGTCFGDSGGPLVANGKLIGIISWGSPCAIGDPDVYTNVQEFLPWIYSKIRQLDGKMKVTQSPSRGLLPTFNNFNYDIYEPIINN